MVSIAQLRVPNFVCQVHDLFWSPSKEFAGLLADGWTRLAATKCPARDAPPLGAERGMLIAPRFHKQSRMLAPRSFSPPNKDPQWMIDWPWRGAIDLSVRCSPPWHLRLRARPVLV